MENLTREYLLNLFDYNREQGVLIWKNHWRPANAEFLRGRVAGSIWIDERRTDPVKYVGVGINRVYYYLHKIIWFLETDEWAEVIDHIDGNGLNNKFDNLRSVSNRKNSQNRKVHRNGKLVGAWWSNYHGTWRSEITVNGKKIHLGSYATELEAHLMYGQALINHGLV